MATTGINQEFLSEEKDSAESNVEEVDSQNNNANATRSGGSNKIQMGCGATRSLSPLHRNDRAHMSGDPPEYEMEERLELIQSYMVQ